jgi:hypothetical protein
MISDALAAPDALYRRRTFAAQAGAYKKNGKGRGLVPPQAEPGLVN